MNFYDGAVQQVGTNNFGTRITNVGEVLDTCDKLGIHELDTARAYNSGASEDALGAALATSPVAGNFTVGTKVTWMKCGYDQVVNDLAASLDSLGKPAVDIYYLHAPVRRPARAVRRPVAVCRFGFQSIIWLIAKYGETRSFQGYQAQF